MADIIHVNFKDKHKIDKYTIFKNVCVVCFRTIIYDSRKESTGENEEYIAIEKSRNQCICKNCSVAIKEIVDENDWK